MVELNTLTLPDISVEKHGRDIEVQGWMYQPQNTLTVLQNTLTVELNTLTLPDISVEEHGMVIEVQGMDVPATEHLDCITEHLDITWCKCRGTRTDHRAAGRGCASHRTL